MACRYIDSCGDHLAAGNVDEKVTGSALAASPVASIVSGRNGNAYNDPNFMVYAAYSGHTIIFGGAWKWTGSTETIYTINDSTASGSTRPQVILQILTDGSLRVRRSSVAGAILGTSATSLIASGTWDYYIEFKATIDSSTGSFEVRVNGVNVLSATAVNTTNEASGYDGTITSIDIGASGTGSQVDDLYVFDGSNSVNADFFGDAHVEAILPHTDAVDAGDHAGLTPSSGSDHGALVDESAPNSDTDYNASASVAEDTYNFPIMTSSGAPAAVQVLLYARKSDSATKSAAPVVRHSGTDYDGTTVALGETYVYVRQAYDTNPGTGIGWTSHDINTLQVGLKVVS